jgi:hypothetical protein
VPSLIKMPGSKKEKRGQVHKRFKEANYGQLETQQDIDRIYPKPKHYRMMPPHLKELMMKDPRTMSRSEALNVQAISEHYKALYEEQRRKSREDHEKKHGKK